MVQCFFLFPIISGTIKILYIFSKNHPWSWSMCTIKSKWICNIFVLQTIINTANRFISAIKSLCGTFSRFSTNNYVSGIFIYLAKNWKVKKFLEYNFYICHNIKITKSINTLIECKKWQQQASCNKLHCVDKNYQKIFMST